MTHTRAKCHCFVWEDPLTTPSVYSHLAVDECNCIIEEEAVTAEYANSTWQHTSEGFFSQGL